MALRVTPSHLPGIKALLELSDETVAKLLNALKEAGPEFNTDDLGDRLSESSKLPNHTTRRIANILGGLYLAIDQLKPTEDLGSFLDENVFPSLKRDGAFSTENESDQWRKLKTFFVSALLLERSVGNSAKAGPVLTEHEHIFDQVRIMTDIRPIFHHNVSDKPSAALIVQMLKITQRDTHGNRCDSYFALDSNDIAKMRDALERAAQKEATLRAALKDTGIKILNVKATY